MAILGVGGRRGKVVTTAVEHAAVRESCNSLGAVVVPVSSDGVVNLDALASELSSDVSLVSVMLVNNEVGVVQPLAEVAALVREKAPGALLHTDAVQAFAWLDVAYLVRVADLVSVSAHKFGGPKGTGALVVRDGASIRPVMFGGGHERGRRPGTQNVAGALGMAAAMAATVATRDETLKRVSALRDRLADGILSSMDGVVETGARDLKVAGNCHLRFDGVEGEALLVLLDEMGVSASAGSACSSGATEASHVLLAMGLTREEASSSVRLSLGYATSRDEVDLSLEVIPKAVSQLRRSPG
jgi:cysteine desulfurase